MTETQLTLAMAHLPDGFNSVAWSPDGGRLASGSADRTVRIWDTGSWEICHSQVFDAFAYQLISLAFVPPPTVHRTFGKTILGDPDVIVETISADLTTDASADTDPKPTLRRVSAKLMLMGESYAGKSALALRLTEDRFEPQTSTHAMRIWEVPPERIHPNMAAPDDETRELVIWDLGGQQEYQLVHQLFLQDTHLALLLLDPTRDSEFDHIDAWCLRLKKQRGEQELKRLLVGAKSDEIDTGMIDGSRVDTMLDKWRMTDFYLTSAKTGDGVDSLREAIAAAVDWDHLSRITRPLFFQQIRDLIDEKRRTEAVVLYGDLDREVSKRYPDEYERASVDTVVSQLAGQGAIADTRLSTGERALVLRIGAVEQYAGSLVRLARDRFRNLGVPALSLSDAIRCRVFPGINDGDRLPPLDERSVLECVVELMLDRGLCLEQNAWLVFPTLFPETMADDAPTSGERVSLYYDFSGAIDNIYAALVTRLAVSGRFGRVRLWPGRALYDQPGQGMCGLKRKDRSGGWSHLDLVFGLEVSEETRNLFTLFVEEHLREHGVTIREVLDLKCVNPSCGNPFDESLVHGRIERGENDIVCSLCEARTPISKDAATIRKQTSGIGAALTAVKKNVDENTKRDVREAKQAMGAALEETVPADVDTQPARLLHLSDLHFSADDDPVVRLQPLLADLRDMGIGRDSAAVDLLAITGDLTNRASPEEFEKVHEFLSALMERLKLTPERCMILPGNHDLCWDEEVYDWLPKRKVEESSLKSGAHVEQGNGYLIRNDSAYPTRFKNFGIFFHQLMQRPYPLNPQEQSHRLLYECRGLQLLGLNSAWEIDEYHQERASIHEPVLAGTLLGIDDDMEKAKEDRRLDRDASVLRLVLFHHPVTGNDKIKDDAFLERLRQAGFVLCLHGHVHEERADLVGYPHPRKLHVIGAGSFGAGAVERPESTPRLYNLLEIAPDHKTVRVHTRAMRRQTGAFEGWAVWPVGDASHTKRDFYEIRLG